MQEDSGAYSTDLNGVAQLSSVDMAMNQGLLLSSANHALRRFKQPLVGGKGRMGIRSSVALMHRWPMVLGLAQSSASRVSHSITVFGNMMIDCLCVCHPRFQNEVIGG